MPLEEGEKDIVTAFMEQCVVPVPEPIDRTGIGCILLGATKAGSGGKVL